MRRNEKLKNLFFTSAINCLGELIEEKIKLEKLSEQNYNFQSKGLTVIVGITEGGKGRMILDMTQETALKLANEITGETYTEIEDFVFITLSEIGNMIAGHGITKMNNEKKGLNLRLTPPSIFSGKELELNVPKVSLIGINLNTEIGEISIHIGFEKLGEDE
ncbi:MAG: hypothetical protein B6I28_05950 [Fusobacteriia bacterium 4572_132]|nr:MAG: hypothetical protein B6I28_05950 [Fusobacteriia bacterium 4572_132]